MLAEHMPLIIFTLCQQLAIGAFIMVGFLLMVNNGYSRDSILVSRRFFFILCFVGIGLLASTFHLGQPFRSINSLNRVGQAWLSNEVVGVGALISMGGLFWLMSMMKPESIKARKGFLFIAMMAALFLIVAMSLTYMLPTAPSWNNNLTPISFTLTMLMLGALASQLLVKGTQYSTLSLVNGLNFIGLLALFSSVIVMGLQLLLWLQTETAVNNALLQISNIDQLVCYRIVASIIAMACWLVWLLSKTRSSGGLWLTIILVAIAEGIGRFTFLSSHMTIGL